MVDADGVPEALLEVAKLATALGAIPLNQYERTWDHRIDERWVVHANGHPEPVETIIEESGGQLVSVPPFALYVTYNGWPAGIISASGGTMAAGAAANEDSFIAAVRAVMP